MSSPGSDLFNLVIKRTLGRMKSEKNQLKHGILKRMTKGEFSNQLVTIHAASHAGHSVKENANQAIDAG